MEVSGKVLGSEDDDTIVINAIVDGIKHTASVVRFNDALYIFTAVSIFIIKCKRRYFKFSI